ncbi:MAG: hypothetical protein Q8Q01_01685 [archaeon]|nr:hypothetical protein [archaeon]
MVDKLENIAIGDIPRYLDAYHSCVITYRASSVLTSTHTIIPPDAILLKDIYDTKKKLITGPNPSLESRIRQLEKAGLVKISGNYASLTHEGLNAKYTLIPRD